MGCETSVISHRLMLGVPLTPANQTLHAANGIVIPLLGRIKLTLSLRKSKIENILTVFKVTDELILGIDWLRQNPCQWNFARNGIDINGEWTCLIS